MKIREELAMTLAYDVFGDGPTILLIHGGGEDAGMLGPQAAALAARGWRAVSYDRRGTGSSTRENWPGGGADQHADDAAALLRELGAAPATVLGFSSGGVVAMALAARHPDVLSGVIAWEPATVSVLPGGDEIHAAILAPIDEYLAGAPEDWVGAYHVALRVLSEDRADLSDPNVVRSARNAEAMMRDDARLLTNHVFQPGELPADKVTIATGTGVSPLHRDIAAALTARFGLPRVEVPEADDHEIYLSRPDVLASFLTARAGVR